MDAEILSGLHAPNKCRNLPANRCATVFPENPSEKQEREECDGTPWEGLLCAGSSDEEFSTSRWVRSRNCGANEVFAKTESGFKPLYPVGLERLM